MNDINPYEWHIQEGGLSYNLTTDEWCASPHLEGNVIPNFNSESIEHKHNFGTFWMVARMKKHICIRDMK